MPSTKKLKQLRTQCTHFAYAALLGTVLATGFAAPALAGSADGTITKINETTNTLSLSNGKTYKLPGEFDYSSFSVGQKVSVFYDSDPSGPYITDIEVQGAPAADTETPSDDKNNSENVPKNTPAPDDRDK